MKKFLGLSFLSFVAALLFLQACVSSCTKDKTIYDTVTKTNYDTIVRRDTVIRKDTVVIKDTQVTAQILTANPWKMQEIRGVRGGNVVYYLRGGTNNTESFDNEYIAFNADGTGVHVENSGIQRAITWQFTNATNTRLTITFYNTPSTFSIYWENLRYKNNSLYYDEYFTDGNTGTNNQYQGIRTPK